MCSPALAPLASADPGTGFTGIDGGDFAARWTSAVDGPQPFPDVSADLAVPITMDDGTVLKADIIHPATGGRRPDTPRPVILQMQGYGKITMNLAQAILKIPGVESVLLPWLARFNLPGSGLDGLTDLTQQLDSGAIQASAQDWDLAKAGYTLVQVDLRGTGTSQGQWQIFGDRERRDTVNVIDWITSQPWSNGNVGTMGNSFTGITALQAADKNVPALKAVFSYVPSADILTDIVAPGGGVGVGFMPFWLLVVNLSKMVPDAESVIAGRFDPAQQLQWLKDRLADPATFLDVIANAYGSTSIDQFNEKTREVIDPNSAFRRGLRTDLANITAPTFVVGAWFDIFGTTPTRTFDELTQLPLEKKKLIMGDGYHVGAGVAGFGHPGMPPRLDVLQRAWFDKWLKGIDNGIDRYSPLTVKQQGGGWTNDRSFPRPEATYRRMYLNDRSTGTAQHALNDGGLAGSAQQVGVRDLTVAPGVMSLCSRDTARISAGATSIVVACTEDSRIWETNGLAFTSGRVTAPTTLSGPINVHLNTVLDATDGYWVATVNDVAPDGRSREISSGQLVTSLRAIDDANSLKSANGDYTQPAYYLALDRRQTVTPGQPVTLDVALTPTDAVLQPGHRLRVDVYASNFPKGLPPTPILADSQLKPEHLRLDPDAPSWVNIPLSAPIPE
ncbi:CocE/NonD family hydrolase [Nocardia terpenica]|uniref:Peptidase n=1 Tax=Nocardia terpenica TaxID=455432 RepID=A0A164JCP2_9NOCA|nr:CocE/NonD family hydrolase [Nocardia terpenica]KZM70272.1 peptidase [Nocardia terpenica]